MGTCPAQLLPQLPQFRTSLWTGTSGSASSISPSQSLSRVSQISVLGIVSVHWYSQPFFLGGLLKSAAIRYGGLPLYRRTVPLAIGLIVGDFVSQGMWVLVLSVLRASGMDV